jgi:hypothetical protein
MKTLRGGRPAVLAALCAAIVSSLAFADAPAPVRDETTLHVRTAAGARDTVRFEGELAPGERRALTTTSGNAATLTRTDAGLVLELAGERFDIAMPAAVDIDLLAADASVDVDAPGRTVVIHRDTRESEDGEVHTGERKIVRIVRRQDADAGDAGSASPEVILEGDSPEVVLLDGEGPRVVVTRRIERSQAGTH